MHIDELLLSQLLDPFRIGLLLALVFTAYNTAGKVGMAIPLILGAIFVAVLIPFSTQREDIDKTMTVVTGLAANAILIGIFIGARTAWDHLRTPGGE